MDDKKVALIALGLVTFWFVVLYQDDVARLARRMIPRPRWPVPDVFRREFAD